MDRTRNQQGIRPLPYNLEAMTKTNITKKNEKELIPFFRAIH